MKKIKYAEIEKSIQAAKEGDAAATKGISSLQAIRDFIVQKDYSVQGVLRDNSSQKAAYKAKKRKQETEKNLVRERRAGQDDRGLSLPKWDGDETVKDKDGNYKVKTGETEHPWPLVEIISPSDEPVFSFAMTYSPAIKDYQKNEIAINDEEKLKKKFSSKLKNARQRREKADEIFTNIIKQVRRSIFGTKKRDADGKLIEEFPGFTYEKYLKGQPKRKYASRSINPNIPAGLRRRQVHVIAHTFLESTRNYLMEKNRRVLAAFRFRIGKLRGIHYRVHPKIKNVITEVMGVLEKTKEAIDQTLREEYAKLMDELEQFDYAEDDAMSDDLEDDLEKYLEEKIKLEELEASKKSKKSKKQERPDQFLLGKDFVVAQEDKTRIYASDEDEGSSAAAQPAAKRRKTKKLKAVAKPSVKPSASAKGRIKRNMVKNTKKKLAQLRF